MTGSCSGSGNADSYNKIVVLKAQSVYLLNKKPNRAPKSVGDTKTHMGSKNTDPQEKL